MRTNLSFADPMSSSVDALSRTLSECFGLEAFRPWQREAIEAVLDGSRRVLLVAPTGGGKSLCYQLPAAMLGGTSIVISPLIALMDDQVRSLEARGIAATYLASTLSWEERQAREARLRQGRYRLVYIAPERLRSEALVQVLAQLAPPLVAIDEAHCISQWGHDFRPDYLRLGEVLAALRPERVIACTATATPAVRDEIMERLALDKRTTTVVLRGFARPNLHLEVSEIDGMRQRRALTAKTLRDALGGGARPRGAAIVYAGTRRECERFADELAGDGWRARAYHAGLEAEAREAVSGLFARRELDVVVATNAFGMGIDRPDIRCVVHLQAPGSIEQYYQEVGRGGRDGAPARGLLLSGSSDFGLRKRLIELGEQADQGYRDRQWGLFLDLMRYVEAGSCRHDFILRYFGDEQELLGGCGHCDVCARFDPTTAGGNEEADALVVRKALAGVARLRGRAGLKALAQSLRGEDNARIRQLGLHELSTHGILSDRTESWIVALLRRLMTAALVDVTPGKFPVPFLTPKGRATMKGETPVRVVLPDDVARARRVKEPRREIAPADPELFERLREVRLAIAREAGVPAYVVCPNRSLEEMAALKPRSVGELATVHGMGPHRIDLYGQRFLQAIAG